MLPLFTATSFLVSCGSFKSCWYYNDGIYGDAPPPKKQYSKSSDGKYYKNYFGEKAKELADNNQNIVLDSLLQQTKVTMRMLVSTSMYMAMVLMVFIMIMTFLLERLLSSPLVETSQISTLDSWSYHYEPYYYGWSYYNTLIMHIIHIIIATTLITITMEIDYYSNPNQYVASSGRRGAPASGNFNLRSNSSNSVDGKGYSSYQIQQPMEMLVQLIIMLDGVHRIAYQILLLRKTKVSENKSSDFMTRDYSTKRNYQIEL